MQQNINQSEAGIVCFNINYSMKLYVLYLLKTRENICFSSVFRAYEMGILDKNWLQGFGRVGHVDLPHKRKSYDIFWKLFYHVLSFLNGKVFLIHSNRNLSSE